MRETFVYPYLFNKTQTPWEVLQFIDVIGLDKIDKDFWSRTAFWEMQRHDLLINSITLSNREWFKDIMVETTQTFNSVRLVPGQLGSLYGVTIYIDEKIPKDMAILCSEDEFAKAVVLINSNWAEYELVMPSQSEKIKLQWITKQIKEDSNEMQNA